MKAKVFITLKKSVLDPQGKTVQHALGSLGFDQVRNVRVGKYIELEIEGTDRSKANDQIKRMCEKLLANTVIEEFRYEIS